MSAVSVINDNYDKLLPIVTYILNHFKRSILFILFSNRFTIGEIIIFCIIPMRIYYERILQWTHKVKLSK